MPVRGHRSLATRSTREDFLCPFVSLFSPSVFHVARRRARTDLVDPSQATTNFHENSSAKKNERERERGTHPTGFSRNFIRGRPFYPREAAKVTAATREKKKKKKRGSPSGGKSLKETKSYLLSLARRFFHQALPTTKKTPSRRETRQTRWQYTDKKSFDRLVDETSWQLWNTLCEQRNGRRWFCRKSWRRFHRCSYALFGTRNGRICDRRIRDFFS